MAPKDPTRSEALRVSSSSCGREICGVKVWRLGYLQDGPLLVELRMSSKLYVLRESHRISVSMFLIYFTLCKPWPDRVHQD